MDGGVVFGSLSFTTSFLVKDGDRLRGLRSPVISFLSGLGFSSSFSWLQTGGLCMLAAPSRDGGFPI